MRRVFMAAAASAISLALLAACGSGDGNGGKTGASAAAVPASTAPAPPPSGTTPGGAPPGGSGSPTYTATGSYTLSTGSAVKSGVTISATAADQSAVLVKNGATLTLRRSRAISSGDSKSSDESSFYGLDATVLASKATVRLLDSAISSTGDGANGLFAYGAGSSASATRTSIKATGQYAHGAMTAGGGKLALRNVTNVVAEGTSSIAATLRHATTLTGEVTKASLTLDGTSRWSVTGDSTLTALAGAKISGTRVTNITGNGHTVTYGRAGSGALGGRTYTLAGGGTLKPA